MALRIAGAVPCGNALEDIDFGDATGALTAAQVLTGLESLPAPVVLVLDEFHEVDDARVIGGLTGLLHDPPPALRLVLIARTEPTLPLHRFRAGGELTEIRARHLAFRAPEAAELPAVHRRRLPVEELAELLDRTEGWVVGLQLLADVLAEQGVLESGEVRAVSDYLLREVLAALPAKMRQFLVRTSVPDEVCGPLADALTGETHSRRLLERLESSNAFVVRIEDRPGWFRYHPLLRDALLHQLALDRPGAEAALHLLAAQWYAGHEQIFEALRHAAEAGDWHYLGRLTVELAMAKVMTGDQIALVDVLRRIPPEQHAATPELALCGAAVRYVSGDRTGVAGLLRLSRSLRAGAAMVPTATDVTLRLMEAGILNWRGRRHAGPDRQIVRDAEAAQLVPAGRAAVAAALPGDRAQREGRRAALDGPRRPGRPLPVGGVDRGAQRRLHGHQRSTRWPTSACWSSCRGRCGRRPSSWAPRSTWRGAPGFETSAQASVSYLVLALIQLERDRIGDAQESLRKALHAGGEEPAAAPAVLAALVRAHLLRAAGDPAAVRALLRQTREEAPATLVAPVLDHWLRLAEAEADLALGSCREVIARYDREAPHGVFTPSEQACLARATLAGGDHATAERLLSVVREGTDHVAAVTAWIATAFAADAEGHGNRSIDALSRAVLIAEREGVRRPFRTFDQRRLAVLLDRRRWVEEHTAAPAVPRGRRRRAAGRPSDVLSERERDVLRYLPTVLTRGEIAGNLNISINTVKAHMRSIYRKLGAARRREAVVRARQLGLL
jgi:LuxR family maltose regulon positive regulatory protein